MFIILRWIVRPVVVTAAGAGGAKAAEESPQAGCGAMLVALGLFVWMFVDIAEIIHRW